MAAAEVHEASKIGFGKNADEYDRVRPTYSNDAAVALLQRLKVLNAEGKHVPGTILLDLAAGTGKFTAVAARLLPACAIIAVEPSGAMRGVLEKALPGVRALEGTADRIPLPDASVDAVVVAQAFHWFSNRASLLDINRVLRPGGTLGLIWNNRDLTQSHMNDLETAIVDRWYTSDVPRQQTGAWNNAFTENPDLFAPLEHATTPYSVTTTPEGVVQRVMTISVINALSDADKAEVRKQILSTLESHPATAGRATFEMPYTTDVYWAEKKQLA